MGTIHRNLVSATRTCATAELPSHSAERPVRTFRAVWKQRDGVRRRSSSNGMLMATASIATFNKSKKIVATRKTMHKHLARQESC
jgi:hypothetical protein